MADACRVRIEVPAQSAVVAVGADDGAFRGHDDPRTSFGGLVIEGHGLGKDTDGADRLTGDTEKLALGLGSRGRGSRRSSSAHKISPLR